MSPLKISFAFLIALMASACNAPRIAPTTTSAPTAPPSVAPTTPKTNLALNTAPGATNRDVTYCAPDGVAQKLDLAYPKQIQASARVAVYVHGGGWTSGDKGGGAGSLDARAVLERGYVVASLNYRLAPQFKWPAQIVDVKCAIRFLRAHASELKIDPNKIGVWGSSAGGHLVAMLGTADTRVGFDVGEWLDQSSRVQAVVDEFGPADLPAMFTANARATGQQIFGSTSRDDPILVQASPITHITKDDPPFLILQGDQDKVVPMEQSQILHDKLKAGGVQSTLVIVKNAGHGFAPTGGAINPTRNELSKMIADFLDQSLR
ncbi:MAG: alpha/beta hydrolase [Chloroflexi bacterium]|nr:alpha/beta hydrolase [Chloroflexota bacterium]